MPHHHAFYSNTHDYTRSAASPQGAANSIKYIAVIAFPNYFSFVRIEETMLPLSYIIQVLSTLPLLLFLPSTPNFTWYFLVARPRLEESSINPVPIHAR